MTPISDDIYCSQQIRVPPALPDILKAYTKAAIRTQPRDLLRWSSAYFGALATGQEPPAKQRLETKSLSRNLDLLPYLSSALTTTSCHLTPELLRALHRQFGVHAVVTADAVRQAWRSLGQPASEAEQLLLSGGFDPQHVPWLQLLALAAGTVCKNLIDTVQLTCNIVADDVADGLTIDDTDEVSAEGEITTRTGKPLPFETFERVYRYLCRIEGSVPQSRIDYVLEYLGKQAAKCNGLLYPGHLQQPDCPSLQFP